MTPCWAQQNGPFALHVRDADSLQIVPLDYWVKGDDPAAHFTKLVAPQIKLQMENYMGHPGELGEAERFITDGH